MDKIIRKIQQNIAELKLFQGVKHVVVGVSGGADSICLLHILKTMQKQHDFDIKAVHVHHGLRGEDADLDAYFVKEFCQCLVIPHEQYNVDVRQVASQRKISEEEAGRLLRYEIFAKEVSAHTGSVIAIAHHLDDQVETVTHHFIRGTGLKGLGGIRPKRQGIIRPLLNVTRKEIEIYLAHHTIPYREDATNKELVYTRNRLRNDLIPKIKKEYNGNFSNNINNMVKLLSQEESFLEEYTSMKFKECAVCLENQCTLDLQMLNNMHTAIKRRILRKALEQFYRGLKDVSFVHIEDMLVLLEGETGKRISLPGQIVVTKEYDRVILSLEKNNKNTKNNTNQDESIEIESFPFRYQDNQTGENLVFTSLPVECMSGKSKKNYTKCFDYDKIKYTLTLRTRQPGDFICLKGISGRKKLKNFFIDNKVSREKRDQQLLLADGKEIIWILGMRVNERYTVTEKTKNVLTISFERSKDL